MKKKENFWRMTHTAEDLVALILAVIQTVTAAALLHTQTSGAQEVVLGTGWEKTTTFSLSLLSVFTIVRNKLINPHSQSVQWNSCGHFLYSVTHVLFCSAAAAYVGWCCSCCKWPETAERRFESCNGIPLRDYGVRYETLCCNPRSCRRNWGRRTTFITGCCCRMDM